MNEWRADIRRMLDRAETVRPPALRRSRREDFLYATDLPGLADRETVEGFCAAAGEKGWKWDILNGWLELTREVREPPKGWTDTELPEETACCASLLERHPAKGQGRTAEREAGTAAEREAGTDDPDGGFPGADAQAAGIALVKAGEEGAKALRQVCARLHRDWAARLRKGEPLPRIDSGFFTGNG